MAATSAVAAAAVLEALISLPVGATTRNTRTPPRQFEERRGGLNLCCPLARCRHGSVLAYCSTTSCMTHLMLFQMSKYSTSYTEPTCGSRQKQSCTARVQYCEYVNTKGFHGVTPNRGAVFLFAESYGAVWCVFFVFCNLMVRFGAVLSKAKPYGAMWFGKNRYRRHRTVPAPSQSFDLKTLTPDPGYILVEFVPCDSVRIFMLGNPRGCLLYTSPSPRD